MKTLVPLLSPAVSAALLLVAACNEPFEPPDNGDPPAVVLRARYLDFVVEGYTYAYFSCDPSGCSDDRTSRPDLELRWDYEADGVWDTEFEPLAFRRDFLPRPLPGPGEPWRVRCEARDEDGLTSAGEDTVTMPSGAPRAPDLVARRAVVDTIHRGWTTTDTVRADQPFFVMLSNIRWLEESDWRARFDLALLVDGEQALTWSLPLVDNLHWGYEEEVAAQYYGRTLRIAEPGVHTLTVILDTGGDVIESDETNNTHTRELVVVP